MQLVEYLELANLSPNGFAKRSLLSPTTIYRALRGDPVHKHTAKRMIKASNKNITWEDLQVYVKKEI